MIRKLSIIFIKYDLYYIGLGLWSSLTHSFETLIWSFWKQ